MQHPFIIDNIPQQPFNEYQLALNDYLLIIQPHEDLYNKIMSLKKSFAETYDCSAAMYSKPHITLLRFMQCNMQEAKIVQQLTKIAETMQPFSIALNGFGSFPTHTIYVNVETKNNIVQLVKQLKPTQALLKLDKERKPHFITEPHLTVARKLLPWQYEKAWLQYSNTPFTASFMASKLLLLKRQEDSKGYTIAATLPLLNKQPAITTQASLFT